MLQQMQTPEMAYQFQSVLPVKHIASLTNAKLSEDQQETTQDTSVEKQSSRKRPMRHPNALRAYIQRGGYRFTEVAEETGIAYSTPLSWAWMATVSHLGELLRGTARYSCAHSSPTLHESEL